MVEPISLSIAILSAVVSISLAVIEIFKGGSNCESSKCCLLSSVKTDIHDNKIGKFEMSEDKN